MPGKPKFIAIWLDEDINGDPLVVDDVELDDGWYLFNWPLANEKPVAGPFNMYTQAVRAADNKGGEIVKYTKPRDEQ